MSAETNGQEFYAQHAGRIRELGHVLVLALREAHDGRDPTLTEVLECIAATAMVNVTLTEQAAEMFADAP